MIIPVIQSCLLLLLPLIVPSSAAECGNLKKDANNMIVCPNDKPNLLVVKNRQYEKLDFVVCKRGKLEGKMKGAVKFAIRSDEQICHEECRVTANNLIHVCLPTGHCTEATREKAEFTCGEGFHLQLLLDGAKAWTGISKQICTGETVQNVYHTATGESIQTLSKKVSIQCRKNMKSPTPCDVSAYFDKSQCDGSSICTKPTLSANKVVCPDGISLEFFMDKWNYASGFTMECNKYNQIDLMKDRFIYEPQLIRCRQEQECKMDIATLSQGISCPQGDKCNPVKLSQSDDKKELICSPGENIEGSELATGKSWFILKKARCVGNSLQLQSQWTRRYEQFTKLRCHKPRLCSEMDKFFDATLCEENKICQMPDSSTYKCENGFTTEWADSNPLIFSAVDSIVCDSQQLMVLLKVGSESRRSDRIPIGFRCSKDKGCDLSDNYEPLTCEIDYECNQPELDQNILKCSSGYELQMKKGDVWSGVQSITCISNVLKAKNVNGEDSVIVSARCTRKKCATCSNPCPTCLPPFNFKESTKLDECASFECGVNSRIVVGSDRIEGVMECDREGESKWKTTNGTKIDINGDVKCEKLCTLQTQLISSCDGNDLCETVAFNDYEPIKCYTKLARKSERDGKVTKGSELHCDRDKGEWMFTTLSTGIVKVEEKDNFYCAFNCDIYSFCRECVSDEHSPSVYRCPEGKEAVVVDSVSQTRKSSNASSSFSCKKGRWIDEMGNSMDGTDEISCEIPTNSSPSTGASVQTILAVYIIGLLFMIIVIAISLTYIVCRMQGKGWLHNIVLAKIRGDKKKEKRVIVRRKDKKSGKSPMVDSGKSGGRTEKDNEQSSAENVLPSGEKMSAEPSGKGERMNSENAREAAESTNNPTMELSNDTGNTVDRNAPQMYYA